jgi:hypothetical protein
MPSMPARFGESWGEGRAPGARHLRRARVAERIGHAMRALGKDASGRECSPGATRRRGDGSTLLLVPVPSLRLLDRVRLSQRAVAPA